MFKKLSDKVGRISSFFLNHPPGIKDALILSVFVLLITFQPFYTQGEINLFELGLYLPGIQAILDGQIPYRDFFHLRGPLELYLPALVMKIFGMHLAVMYTYFYVGNIVCLILCVWILKELLSTRFVFYLAVPVLVARTFPRVVFMIWGGMRYAWGLLAVLLVIKFFKTKRPGWMFAAGVMTSIGLLTSIEIGVCIIAAAVVTYIISWVVKLEDRKILLRSAGFYFWGNMVVAGPCLSYLAVHHALVPYIDSVISVIQVMQMHKVLDPHLISTYPHNLPEALAAMTNFNHTNFKHMTPSYFYILLLGYLVWRIRKGLFNKIDLGVLFLGSYGFVMYNASFRGIWASQFDMALMPEKVLYFFILEFFLLALVIYSKLSPSGKQAGFGKLSVRIYNWKKMVVYLFFLGLFLSSIGYAISRYNHRFIAFKIVRDVLMGKNLQELNPHKELKILSFPRAKGIKVPAEQADELEAVIQFLNTHTASGEVVATYPELGIYNFFADRPFLGRFPLATFSWFRDPWHEELISQLKSAKAKYIILQKQMSKDWKDMYLGPENNRKKYEETLAIIHSDYKLTASTPDSYIYELIQ